MSGHIRLFPTLIIFCLAALMIKAIALTESMGVANAAPDNIKEDTAKNADDIDEMDSGTDNSDKIESSDNTPEYNETASPNPIDPDRYIAEQAGLTQYEIQVLRSLSERRKQLDIREEALEFETQALAAAQLRLDEQITQLQTLESRIRELLGQLDEHSEAQIAGLVKVYENMKPKDAARIFDSLEDDLLLKVTERLKPGTLAVILPNMSIERASQLTRLLAQKSEIPHTIDDLTTETG